jgi:hypothetical protein
MRRLVLVLTTLAVSESFSGEMWAFGRRRSSCSCPITCNMPVAAPERRPSPPRDDARTVTYRFTARIKSNDGVLPFKVGNVIEGTFTYDLESKPRFASHPRNVLDSTRNALSFHMGELRFTGSGQISVTIADYKHAEHFGIGASDLVLPKGWDMDHTAGSQTYSVLFQNAPAKGVIAPAGIPDRISLPSFVNTRELRLDFFHGVRFPGGQVNRRAVVFATVESLESQR